MRDNVNDCLVFILSNNTAYFFSEYHCKNFKTLVPEVSADPFCSFARMVSCFFAGHHDSPLLLKLSTKQCLLLPGPFESWMVVMTNDNT